jgi:hypothetical protein
VCYQTFRRELSKRTVLTQLIKRRIAQGASEADAVAAVEAQRVASGTDRFPGTLNKLWLLVSKGSAPEAPPAPLPTEGGVTAGADAAAAGAGGGAAAAGF